MAVSDSIHDSLYYLIVSSIRLLFGETIVQYLSGILWVEYLSSTLGIDYVLFLAHNLTV